MIGLLKKTQNRNKKLVALIDGEHYPKINLDAIELLKRTFKGEFEGAIFLGGTEKLLGDDPERFYGCRVIKIKNFEPDFLAALDVLRPDIVYDLSDEPVVNYFTRMKIASCCFAKSSSYMGPDFYFEHEPGRIALPATGLMIIGTGKRIGKTAVSSYVSRLLSKDRKVCIIAMGRGGPEKPQLIEHSKTEITPEFLLEISRKGFHASSDYIEDALFANVDTVGCRRCGGGFGGKFFLSNIEKGVKMAKRTGADIFVVEGSGASVPPVKTGFRICVVGANQKWESLVGYLGLYRMMTSDLVFMTMCEEPVSSEENMEILERQIKETVKDARIVRSIFRPEPLYGIEGRNVFLVLTANKKAENNIKNYLEKQYGCTVAGISFNLSDRKKLYDDLKSKNAYDMILTELKAASVDVVTEYAVENKKMINYLNNIPVITSGQEHLENLIKKIRTSNGKQ
jgi:cyclic 2,3-diphosphoglycerate synthase